MQDKFNVQTYDCLNKNLILDECGSSLLNMIENINLPQPDWTGLIRTKYICKHIIMFIGYMSLICML